MSFFWNVLNMIFKSGESINSLHKELVIPVLELCFIKSGSHLVALMIFRGCHSKLHFLKVAFLN